MFSLLEEVHTTESTFAQLLEGRLPPDELPAIATGLVRLHQHVARTAAAEFAAAPQRADLPPAAGDVATEQGTSPAGYLLCLSGIDRLMQAVGVAATQQLQADLLQSWQQQAVRGAAAAEAPWATSVRLLRCILQRGEQAGSYAAQMDAFAASSLGKLAWKLAVQLLQLLPLPLPGRQQQRQLQQAGAAEQAPGINVEAGGTQAALANGQGSSDLSLLPQAASAAVLEALPHVAAGLGDLCQLASTSISAFRGSLPIVLTMSPGPELTNFTLLLRTLGEWWTGSPHPRAGDCQPCALQVCLPCALWCRPLLQLPKSCVPVLNSSACLF